MRRVRKFACSGTVLAVAMLLPGGPAEAAQFCTPGPGPADPPMCTEIALPIEKKFDREQRTIDTRTHMDRFTYELVPKVEEQDSWPFPGRRIWSWKRGGLEPNRQNLSRLRQLRGEQ